MDEQIMEISKFLSTSKTKFKSICLQYPDELLGKSSGLISRLKSLFPHITFSILADTSFGSCCVDEVAAEHVNADLVLHFGPSCMTKTTKIPAYHVFEQTPVDILSLPKLLEPILKDLKYSSAVVIFPDVEYQHAFECKEQVLSLFDAEYRDKIHIATIDKKFIAPDCLNNDDDTGYLGRYLSTNAILDKTTALVQIGSDELFLNALSMDFYGSSMWRIDPSNGNSCEDLSSQLQKRLSKRYSSISKAADSEIIGILVGTLGTGILILSSGIGIKWLANYSKIIERMKKIIRNAGKRPYVVLVGKLNVAKLANFSEISTFVHVSCPLSSVVDDKEYLQNLVTPFELEIALGYREWNPMQYQTNYQTLLQDESCERNETVEDCIDEMEKLVIDSTSLALRNQQTALIASGLESSLSKRTWYGLDTKEGCKEISLMKEGRKGIARSYN